MISMPYLLLIHTYICNQRSPLKTTGSAHRIFLLALRPELMHKTINNTPRPIATAIMPKG
jgi:hypothetical protein